MEVAVCVPPELEVRVLDELERHGHHVVLRAATAIDLEAAIATVPFSFALCGGSAEYLSARLLAACDAAGVRIVPLTQSEADRRAVRALGIHESLPATADWDDIETALFGGLASAGGEAAVSRRLGAGPSINAASAAPSGRDPLHGGQHGVSADRAAPFDAGQYGAGPHDVGQYGAGPYGAGKHDASPHDSGPRRSEVIAVWGPAGSPGRTTLAIAIAAELAASGASVVLADADTHSGTIAPALGLLDEAPGFAAACRLAATESLSTEELERVAERYRSPHGSFWVLTRLGRPHRWPELSAERVVATIAACREWVDYTVLDTGFSLENDEEISSDLFAPRRNAATIAALREADRVVAVGAGDPVGLSRFLRAHVDLVDLVEVERIETVVNKIRGSAIGLNPGHQVAQTLDRFGGITNPVLVPHDQAAMDAAVLSGKSLREVAPRSPAQLAVSAFVTGRLLPRPAESMPRRRLSPRVR